MISTVMISALILAADAAHSAGSAVNWMVILTIIQSVLVVVTMVTGMFFVMAGAIGVLRLPDFYTRLHAAGMTDTLGAELIILGLIIQAGFSQVSLKLLLVSFLLLLTSPTATHAVANAAHRMGVKPKLGTYKVKSVAEISRETTPEKSS